MNIYQIMTILLMIVLTALFVCYEMALVSISHARLLVLHQQKKQGATAALYMKDHIEASLAVLQMGTTLAGALAAAAGGVGVGEKLVPYVRFYLGFSESVSEILALAIFVIPLSAVTIVFAELIPKMFAIRNKEWVCLTLSPPIAVVSRISYPIISIFEHVIKSAVETVQKIFHPHQTPDQVSSLHEFAAAVSIARTARLIGAREEKIVLSASQFPIRSISQIMIPAADISMIDLKTSLTEALLKAHLDLHTRFPVCEESDNAQTIKGYITFKDLVVALKMSPKTTTLADILRPLRRFSSQDSIAYVLEYMIHEKVHITLVQSEDEVVVGMVTLEDIIEELVGDIEDEFDRLPSHIHATANGWIVGGGVHMDFLSKSLKVQIPEIQSGSKPITLAEWCVNLLERPLSKGESFHARGFFITVRKLRRKKLAECFISLG